MQGVCIQQRAKWPRRFRTRSSGEAVPAPSWCQPENNWAANPRKHDLMTTATASKWS